MAGEAIVKASEGGKKMAGERALRNYLDEFDRKYWVSGGPVLWPSRAPPGAGDTLAVGSAGALPPIEQLCRGSTP